jgi:hypothetical protein
MLGFTACVSILGENMTIAAEQSLHTLSNEYSDESVQPFWTKVYNCGVEKLSLKSNDFLFLFSHRFAF